MIKWLQPGLWMFAARPDEVKFFEANLYSLQQGQLSSFSLFSIQTREFKKTCSCDSIRGIAICFKTRVKPSYLVFSSPFQSLMYNGNMSSDFRVMSGSSTRSVNHMCLYLLDVTCSQVNSWLPLHLLAVCSLSRSFVASLADQNASWLPDQCDQRFSTHEIFTSWHLVLSGAPNSSMALDNLSKSSSLQSPEVSWVKEIWSQKSGRWIRNQKTNFVFLSLKIFTKQLSGLHQPATTAHYLLVSQAQPPRANLTLSCHQQSWIHA